MRRLMLSTLFLAVWTTLASAQSAIVPSPVPALTNNCTLKWQTATSTWVCSAASAASQPLTTSYGLIADATTPTKVLAFDVSAIDASTTRTVTWPNANLTIPSTVASLAANTFTGLQTLNGGLAATTGTFSSTLGVTGVATFTAQPVLSSLTPSLPVFTDAAKGLVSRAMTGTGNVVMSASPTLTGTIGAAAMTLSSTLGVTGITTLTGALAANGGITVDATNFTVNGTTGATHIAGDLDVATDKFTVAAATGNTAIAGTLGVTGVSTLAGVTSTVASGAMWSNTVAGNNYKWISLTNDGAQGYFGIDTSAGGAFSAGNYATVMAAFTAGGVSLAARHASGAIRFYTGGATLRWTMNPSGSLQWGEFGTGNTYSILGQGTVYLSTAGTAATNAMLFSNDNATVGYISTSGSTTMYGTSSDRRLKRDRGVATSTEVIQRIAVHDFDWIADGTRDRGVFAQEAYDVFPRAVSVGTDDTDAAGHLVRPWAVDYSKYVPDLIVGWQAHESRLAALEARVVALETKEEE